MKIECTKEEWKTFKNLLDKFEGIHSIETFSQNEIQNVVFNDSGEFLFKIYTTLNNTQKFKRNFS